VTAPDGFATRIDVGFANLDSRAPIAPGTLFQIGSITKCMTALVLHQLAAEGRLALSGRIDALMPTIPLPRGNAITIQHLLDHVAGLPADAPLFPDGGLWTAYAPSAHWHYSNTAYEILGKLAEQIGGKPLDRLFEERIFAPLRMTSTRGAIVGSDRARYAQGYEAADQLPFARGVALAPAAWVDVTAGGMSVASTADDMNRFMRALAGIAQGRGGLGLSPAQGRAFAAHAVASDSRAMTYGNGLMHVGSGGRSYLHHTGGMVSFSSSFHLDLASGCGAFASANIGAFAEYRPRQLTRFAADALTDAVSGRPLPSPPALGTAFANAASYVGHYSGPARSFEIGRSGPSGLTIAADGQSADLEVWGGEIFRTLHPAFHRFSLAGRYVSDSPWLGLADVVERGGRLWLGTEVPLERASGDLWRVGTESWTPERASFANMIDGRPQTFVYSGQEFVRHDI